MALELLAQQIFASLLGMWVGQAAPPAEAKRHVECLAENVWFEARGGDFEAKPVGTYHIELLEGVELATADTR